MNAKFTPGEWSVSELPIRDRDGEMRLAKISIVAPRQDDQYSIFSVGKVDFSLDHPGFIPCDLEEAEANARLFAASKKMLEALKDTVVALAHLQDTLHVRVNPPTLENARAAIAKATGETT